MPLHWNYKRTDPFHPQGKDTVGANFAREERSGVAILIREALQNALDARLPSAGPVSVFFTMLAPRDYDTNFLAQIVDREFVERLRASSGVALEDAADSHLLTIEDFGTKGLLGAVDDPDRDGDDQNWNAFWHREGEGAKGRGGGANGGAGQGKVTYFKHSRAGLVLGHTIRHGDPTRLLFGRAAFLRDYPYLGAKYVRNVYWTTSSDRPRPETNPMSVDGFCRAFRLRRSGETGLSLVIPFISSSVDFVKECLLAVLLDFYVPVSRGVLIVHVNGREISSSTIDDVCREYLDDRTVEERASCFTLGYRDFCRRVLTQQTEAVALAEGWNERPSLDESVFPPGSLDACRSKLEEGGRITVELPISVKKRGQGSSLATFEVHLEVPQGLTRSEEAYIRGDLLIGGESHVRKAISVNARCLTWVHDPVLSDFLLAAEEPTHLKWNGALLKERGVYSSPDSALRGVRQAAPRLLNVLLRNLQRRDTRVLAGYFGRPSLSGALDDRAPQARPGLRTRQQAPELTPMPKPFRINGVDDRLLIDSNGASGPDSAALPLILRVDVAYEGLGRNPFADYDPFDFDLAEPVHHIEITGGSVLERGGNRLLLRVEDSAFHLSVAGFDPHVRLRAKLAFESIKNIDGEQSVHGPSVLHNQSNENKDDR